MTRHSVHVAAMPFPSPQGTQASIASMLRALSAYGETPELWTYAHGATAADEPFRIHRLADFPRDRSLRSGPSVNKVLLDAQLAARLALNRDATPVIAHHVEAAFAAWLARRPFVFFAHTDMAAELPSYAQRGLAPALRIGGAAIDHLLIRAAHAVAAISPLLSTQLEQRYGRPVHYVPTPWPTCEPNSERERLDARASLRIARDAKVVLYAGNLDAYQGWQDVLHALAIATHAQPSLRSLVATPSDPAPLRSLAHALGIASRLTVAPLMSESDRARCHAAADIAVVPRRIPGGLPIKLLDALSRGVATVATRRAIAGLTLDHAAQVVNDDAPEAIARALLDLLAQGPQRRAQIEAGSAYLRRHHSPSKFLAAFDAVRGG